MSQGFTQNLSVGRVIQIVNTQTGAVASGSTAIPSDDSIPQNTEGDEYMTLAITPTNASNILIVEVVIQCSGTGNPLAGALFQDSTANALAACQNTVVTAGDRTNLIIKHKMTAGTTSSTTFKVRAGGASGTFTFNGVSGGRLLGGVMSSSITITEIKA